MTRYQDKTVDGTTTWFHHCPTTAPERVFDPAEVVPFLEAVGVSCVVAQPFPRIFFRLASLQGGRRLQPHTFSYSADALCTHCAILGSAS